VNCHLAAASPARPGGGSMKKAARSRRCPCHHNLEKDLDEYIKAGTDGDLDGPLFRTAAGVAGREALRPECQHAACCSCFSSAL
jgi:hypothetical protein